MLMQEDTYHQALVVKGSKGAVLDGALLQLHVHRLAVRGKDRTDLRLQLREGVQL